jgi:anti-sigma B factor antagonist
MIEDVGQEISLDIEVSGDGPVTTVAVSGEIDITTAPQLEAAVAELQPAERLVLDLRGVSFMDSTGVRLVMALDLRSRAEGWAFAIARSSGPVAHVLDLCRIPDRVRTVDDPADVA